MNQILVWLQNYNSRHFDEYEGMATIQFCDDGSGALFFNETLIVELDLNKMDDVRDYLLEQ